MLCRPGAFGHSNSGLLLHRKEKPPELGKNPVYEHDQIDL